MVSFHALNSFINFFFLLAFLEFSNDGTENMSLVGVVGHTIRKGFKEFMCMYIKETNSGSLSYFRHSLLSISFKQTQSRYRIR